MDDNLNFSSMGHALNAVNAFLSAYMYCHTPVTRLNCLDERYKFASSYETQPQIGAHNITCGRHSAERDKRFECDRD
ncbi:hypothetical protein D3C81_1997940 [compost metagenome]